MQTDKPKTPASALAAAKKTRPSKATPIGRDISDAKLRAMNPAEKAYRQAVGGGLYLEVMPTGSKLWRWKYRLDRRETASPSASTQGDLNFSNRPVRTRMPGGVAGAAAIIAAPLCRFGHR